jgi:hypothetical protein
MMKVIENAIIKYAAFIALLILLIVIACYVFNFHNQIISDDVTKWGVFGDFVGGTLNPFLSFLALIILLRTFSMQQNELELQREELSETKKILEIQTKTQLKQQFDSTFFALLNVHNQVFQDLPNNSIDNTHSYVFSTNLPLDMAKELLASDKYLCGHYFQILCEILIFINNAPENNQCVYSNILRALLSDNTMRLLLIYCCSESDQDEKWKYKILIERYAMFENASFSRNLKWDNTRRLLNLSYQEKQSILRAMSFYDNSAFGINNVTYVIE